MEEPSEPDTSVLMPPTWRSKSLVVGGLAVILACLLIVVPVSRRTNDGSNHLLAEEDTCVQTLFGTAAATPLFFWTDFVYQTALTAPRDRCQPNFPQEKHQQKPQDYTCGSHFEPHQQDIAGIASQWQVAWERNLELVRDYQHQTLDVALLGDSMTEHWMGTDLGRAVSSHWTGNHQAYLDVFSNLTSVALGIGGDRVIQLLYRLLHGEMVRAKIYWVLIGINDYLGPHCSSDMIVAGNLHVIRLLKAAHPNAIVVVNSLLPMNPNLPLHRNPSWKRLHDMNQKLACYASSTAGVEFFNATPLFVDETTGMIHGDMLSDDHFHPGEHGSRVWGNAIVRTVHDLLSRRDRP